jgi:hypothetical protein
MLFCSRVTVKLLGSFIIAQAVKTSSGDILLSAFDHRAGTYEKLDRLQLALRDAREMMELKPGVSKVWLEILTLFSCNIYVF